MNEAKRNEMCAGAACWPPLEEIDGETEQLVALVETGWDWKWPGWKSIAADLNQEYGKNRTAQQCRRKYNQIYEARLANTPAREPRKENHDNT
jgi:hypothetical protein